MGTMRKSADLLKQSFSVLRQDKQLVVFPLLSAVACAAVLVSFLVPTFATGLIQFASTKTGHREVSAATKPLLIAISFAYYFVNYTVIVFFNSALVSCALERFDGGKPTVRSGLEAAARLLPQILAWSLVAATVGTILRALEERVGFLGKLAVGFVGFAWTIATYFVVPVLVVEKAGPIDAVKRSATILKDHWGTSLVSNIGLGLINFLVVVACVLPLIAGGIVSGAMETTAVPVIIGGSVTVFLLVIFGLVTSAMQSILVAALYRYAAGAGAPAGFDSEAMKRAFAAKK
ncbi:MAG: DUF6159 family protein [Phycisphaerales bacterium]|nr:hypothetical protein [Planctomycetota bacterium]